MELSPITQIYVICGALDVSQLMEPNVLGSRDSITSLSTAPNNPQFQKKQGVCKYTNLISGLLLYIDLVKVYAQHPHKWELPSISKLSFASNPRFWAIGGLVGIAMVIYLRCVDRSIFEGRSRRHKEEYLDQNGYFDRSEIITTRRQSLIGDYLQVLTPARAIINLVMAYIFPRIDFFTYSYYLFRFG
ncbi:MAG: hypothetical protein LVR00_05880 [Rhabdochlamydiaceae bacterium]|jgi:hypothetical protein